MDTWDSAQNVYNLVTYAAPLIQFKLISDYHISVFVMKSKQKMTSKFKTQLEMCPHLRIKVRPTTLGFGVGIGVRIREFTLTFNPRRATVMTHTHAKCQGQRSLCPKENKN